MGSHLITYDAAARWRVILSLVRALTCGILLVVETLLEVWFQCWIQASHAVDLDGVETSDGC
jgi:hypothetical protein